MWDNKVPQVWESFTFETTPFTIEELFSAARKEFWDKIMVIIPPSSIWDKEWFSFTPHEIGEIQVVN